MVMKIRFINKLACKIFNYLFKLFFKKDDPFIY